MPAQTETRKILIKVDAPGVKEAVDSVARSMGVLNKNTKSMANNMSLLSNAFQAWLGFISVREIVGMSDTMQNLTNRLKLSAQAGENASETFTKLTELADRQKLSIGAAGDVYNRFAISLSALKPRAEEIIALSEVLIASFRLAGATTTETANTMIQLSQAFSSGELRGQELRSVMEQNGVLAGILREKFGADIYKKAEKGLIRVVDVMQLLFDNQEKLIEQAETMAPTFEQTLTKAMNTASIKVKELNDNFHLSAGFAEAMGVAVKNLDVIMFVFASATLSLVISKIMSLAQVLKAFALGNPITAGLLVLSTIAVAIYDNWDSLVDLFERFRIKVLEMAISVEEGLLPTLVTLDKYLGGDAAVRGAERISTLKLKLEELQNAKDDAFNEDMEYGQKLLDMEERQAAAASLLKKQREQDAKNQKERPLKEILGDLNKEFMIKKDIDLYNKKLVAFEHEKLKRKFKKGDIDIFGARKQLEALNIQGFNRDLKEGELSWSAYNEKVKQNKLMDVTEAFEAGKISLTEYNEELLKLSDSLQVGGALYVGTEQYLKSIGTLSQNIAQGITDTFKHLEDSLVDFIKKGTFNFAKFTEAVMDDLLRIIIRASILRPLSEGILNAVAPSTVPAASGGSGGNYSVGNAANLKVNALGNAFDGSGIRAFANGGVVGHPTMFRYGGNKTGIMGEAGPEAILPLQRGSGGKLGVAATTSPVVVNIINQSGAQAQQRETTGPDGSKVIEVLITNKVREGFATGKFDGAMKQNYGLTRKGS